MMNLLTNSTTFAYFTSTQDWLIIGVIALVLFGGTKIPQLAKGLGEGIREFKSSINEATSNVSNGTEKDSN